MNRQAKLIIDSFNKFHLDLHGKTVLTEAATGNYVCTAILAAMAGAKVYAIAKNSRFGSALQAHDEVISLAKEFNIENQITIIFSLGEIDLGKIDIVTNTGFVRPIDKLFIEKLKPDCVIPLMFEPWEFRADDLDLESAVRKGIKIYGTNESDIRLQTMDYIGLTVLYFLLNEKRSPFSSRLLLIGCEKFNKSIEGVLKSLNYSVTSFVTEEYIETDIKEYDTVIIAEHINSKLIIGETDFALIKSSLFTREQLVIHISGNVDFTVLQCKHFPEFPAAFGYMSYTTDFIDPMAVIDLHTAGLKVGEGMLNGIEKGLSGMVYKESMESNFPALAFDDEKYW